MLFRNAPGNATALMGASRRGHSRIVELLLQVTWVQTDLFLTAWAFLQHSECDGHTAIHQARTHRISIKIHNQASKSRSMEDILSVKNSSSHFVKSRSTESVVSDDSMLDENQSLSRPLIPPPPSNCYLNIIVKLKLFVFSDNKVSTSILKKLHFLAVKKNNKKRMT